MAIFATHQIPKSPRGLPKLETVATRSTSYDTTFVISSEVIESEIQPMTTVFDPSEIAFELGVWLLGLQAFAAVCNDAFAGEQRTDRSEKDSLREFRIMHAALLKSSQLAFRLRKTLAGNGADFILNAELSVADLDELSSMLRDLIVISESLTTSESLSFGEWRSWNTALGQKFESSVVVSRLGEFAGRDGFVGLPEKLCKVFESQSITFSDRSDFDDILPRVGTILRCLEIVGSMLRKDEPIKPALLIFAAVYEQTQTLIEHINNRLARFPDEEAALFNSLDGASYSASLELKKVFQQELRGIVGILPPPSVFARVETAYSLLLDSFQQILIDLARSVDPKASPFDFFPRFQIKLDQSLILRDHLWQIRKAVRAAEQNPEKNLIEGLRQELFDFVTVTIRFLHYKDEETLERFSEEIHAARDKKDLVPILHRFGAYLETLFGQICMRSVLAAHPFDQEA
jgi:hypothetical protein